MADDVSKNLENFINNTFGEALAVGLERVGQLIENSAKRKAPVDDGQLRASITHEVNVEEKEVLIGTNAEYGPFVHEGTGIYATSGNGRKEVPWRYKDAKGQWHTTEGIKPKPFLKDAVEINRGNILKTFGEGAQTRWKK